MTMQEGVEALGLGPAARHDRAYFLDLLGDSLAGLGRYETAVEAYREAAQGFEVQDAPCSRALCLFKIADCYLSLREPWHALGYLEACLPLLREQGLVRYFSLAQDQLAACRAELAPLLGEGRPGRAPPPQAARPAEPSRPARSQASSPGRR
ncbi:MAG TPA: tetratricopeptide repeat protein [Streptosporangiaceae bacterium]|nr:tetratricopeptide repeat protein [Streptosporangiaceae bacterium]